MTDANNVEAIYKELIQPAGKIRFVFSGHIGNSDEFGDQAGYRAHHCCRHKGNTPGSA